MSELPEGWISTTLGQVVNYADNETVDPTDMPPEAWLLELEDIQRDTGKVLEWKTVGERLPKSSKNRFRAGDVLYGKLRPYLNKVVKAEKSGFCSSEIIAISPGLLDPSYLFFSIRSPNFIDYVNDASHGMRMPRLGTQQAKGAPFRLPPLNEQTRIAAKLEELLAQVDTLKTRIDSIPALLRRFRQSILTAAVSGKLTEDWRGSSAALASKPIGDFLEITSGLAFKKEQYANEGSRLLQIANIGYGKTVWESMNYIPMTLARLESRLDLKEGDIVMALNRPITNGRLKVATVTNDDLPATLYQRVARFRPNENELTDSKYIFLCFRTDDFKSQVEKELQGSDQPYINTRSLKNLEIYLPHLDEQTEIVRRVEQLFTFAEQLEARVIAAQTRVDRLTQSILEKGFRGELVPQDPNDEPASALLDRIQAQRAAMSKTKRGRPDATLG